MIIMKTKSSTKASKVATPPAVFTPLAFMQHLERENLFAKSIQNICACMLENATDEEVEIRQVPDKVVTDIHNWLMDMKLVVTKSTGLFGVVARSESGFSVLSERRKLEYYSALSTAILEITDYFLSNRRLIGLGPYHLDGNSPENDPDTSVHAGLRAWLARSNGCLSMSFESEEQPFGKFKLLHSVYLA